jgi:hypothetical protein
MPGRNGRALAEFAGSVVEVHCPHRDRRADTPFDPLKVTRGLGISFSPRAAPALGDGRLAESTLCSVGEAEALFAGTVSV